MVKRFFKTFLLEVVKNRTIILLSLFLIFLVTFAIYLFHVPKFPRNVPSSESTQVLSAQYRTQTDLFKAYTLLIRENHGGIIVADEISRMIAAPGEKEEPFVTFVHRYKRFDKKRVFNLTEKFAKKNNIKLSVKHKKASVKIDGLEDSYLIEFLQQEKIWVKVRIEILESRASKEAKKLTQQYEENLDSYTSDYVDEKKVDDINGMDFKPKKSGKLVIIIDDMGNNMQILHKLISLKFDITYSVLPLLQHTEETALVVHKAEREVMLHLPMEPKDWPKYNPGPGALFRKDDRVETQRKLTENLASVNFAVGVNNHMGSSYTQYAEGLDIVMEKLNNQNLFFVDSKTSAGNTVKNSAKKFEVPYLSRNIFLDNFQSEPYIKKQLYKAVRIAKKHGKAIAIGHPHLATYHVLAAQLPLIQKNGIKIAKASELLKRD